MADTIFTTVGNKISYSPAKAQALVMEFIKALGLDPADVQQVVIRPRGIEVEVLEDVETFGPATGRGSGATSETVRTVTLPL